MSVKYKKVLTPTKWGVIRTYMKKFSSTNHKQNFNPSTEDWDIIKRLQAKLGVRFSNIVRLAIRTLAQKEGV